MPKMSNNLRRQMKIVKTDKQGRVSLKRAMRDFAQYYRIESSSDGNIWLFPLRENYLKELGFEVEEKGE